ncbi:MAG: RecX family transcriptional regulator [Prevotellaceae bacterium]|nr:RecX family transcriptional regulator [Prevotellaceae bacterium]
MTRKTLTEREALERASLLCAGSEHCLSQIKGKLEAWGLTAAARDRVLSRLQREGFIDESRFARAYALDKFRHNHWGRVKIALYLRQLGLGEADREAALEAIPEGEYMDGLRQLLASKQRTVRAASQYELRGKLLRFALARGFTMEEATGCLTDADEPV